MVVSGERGVLLLLLMVLEGVVGEGGGWVAAQPTSYHAG